MNEREKRKERNSLVDILRILHEVDSNFVEQKRHWMFSHRYPIYLRQLCTNHQHLDEHDCYKNSWLFFLLLFVQMTMKTHRSITLSRPICRACWICWGVNSSRLACTADTSIRRKSVPPPARWLISCSRSFLNTIRIQRKIKHVFCLHCCVTLLISQNNCTNFSISSCQ